MVHSAPGLLSHRVVRCGVSRLRQLAHSQRSNGGSIFLMTRKSHRRYAQLLVVRGDGASGGACTTNVADGVDNRYWCPSIPN